MLTGWWGKGVTISSLYIVSTFDVVEVFFSFFRCFLPLTGLWSHQHTHPAWINCAYVYTGLVLLCKFNATIWFLNRTWRVTFVIGSSLSWKTHLWHLLFLTIVTSCLRPVREVAVFPLFSTRPVTVGAEGPHLSLGIVSHCWKAATWKHGYIKSKILNQHYILDSSWTKLISRVPLLWLVYCLV